MVLNCWSVMLASRFAMGTIADGQPGKLGVERIVSIRQDSPYRSGRSADWLKMKNPDAPAVKREAKEDWGKKR
jgi:hypothetical protein